MNLAQNDIPLSIFGMPVYIDPLLDDVPKMQLSEEVKKHLTPKFIAETNAWMREFFGTENRVMVVNDTLPDQRIRKIIFVGRKGLERIKNWMPDLPR